MEKIIDLENSKKKPQFNKAYLNKFHFILASFHRVIELNHEDNIKKDSNWDSKLV